MQIATAPGHEFLTNRARLAAYTLETRGRRRSYAMAEALSIILSFFFGRAVCISHGKKHDNDDDDDDDSGGVTHHEDNHRVVGTCLKFRRRYYPPPGKRKKNNKQKRKYTDTLEPCLSRSYTTTTTAPRTNFKIPKTRKKNPSCDRIFRGSRVPCKVFDDFLEQKFVNVTQYTSDENVYN
ncbi:unnamed protein product [Trichogramma brassicae]|uniref:Uncharacterized protein n=1 Tax=Trichogramma brassicae TaxID=86971 RepID=A0A6H5I9U9_9HYME|nr:unnamed protein product [Trichogramma brassicae]